ncbi:MAG: TonB-dependent receptor [Bacteroidota bacterium]
MCGTYPAQQLTGYVMEMDQGKEMPLPMATVGWQGTGLSAFTNEKGFFTISYPDSFPANLVVSYVGFRPDTIVFKKKVDQPLKIVLKGVSEISTIEVVTKKDADSYLITVPINTQMVTQGELRKAACCNLSESFETNASVDVSYTDAVSGAKQIQLLGLDGVYTQILSENVPLIRGLSSSYGISYVPGTWIESIYITKGTGSVVNGFESISGQIQLELLEPYKSERLFFNFYGNDKSRMEANLHLAKKLSERTSSILFLHASQNQMRTDHNQDQFLDMPLTKQLNALNRWQYGDNIRYEGQVGAKFLYEERQGGQTFFDYKDDFGTTQAYGIGITTVQAEVFTKNGFFFASKPYKSIGIITSSRYHRQDSYFGLKTYKGEQRSFYFNGIWQTVIGETKHGIKYGSSLYYDDYRESFNDSAFSHTDIIPGLFTEYTFNDFEKETHALVIGLRGDYHNRYGFMFNPRVHYKYLIKNGPIIRLSAGKGTRTANIFVENSSVFASSRVILVKEELKPEVAYNYGISFLYTFKLFSREATFNADFFRTDFENQVVVDLENARQVQFYNLDGRSYSNSFQADLNFQPVKGLDVKLAYKKYDVRSTYGGKLLEKPMVPKDRALFNVSYATNFEKWQFDYTLKWLGVTRLPNTDSIPPSYHAADESESYFVMNAQITKRFKVFELYLGAENIMDFVQHRAIIAPEDPFGSNFDASMIWGPVDGRMIYGGLRFSLR